VFNIHNMCYIVKKFYQFIIYKEEIAKIWLYFNILVPSNFQQDLFLCLELIKTHKVLKLDHIKTAANISFKKTEKYSYSFIRSFYDKSIRENCGLKKINGIAVTGPDRAMEAYSYVRRSDKVSVEIERKKNSSKLHDK